MSVPIIPFDAPGASGAIGHHPFDSIRVPLRGDRLIVQSGTRIPVRKFVGSNSYNMRPIEDVIAGNELVLTEPASLRIRSIKYARRHDSYLKLDVPIACLSGRDPLSKATVSLCVLLSDLARVPYDLQMAPPPKLDVRKLVLGRLWKAPGTDPWDVRIRSGAHAPDSTLTLAPRVFLGVSFSGRVFLNDQSEWTEELGLYNQKWDRCRVVMVELVATAHGFVDKRRFDTSPGAPGHRILFAEMQAWAFQATRA